jgi:hypothetical protein
VRGLAKIAVEGFASRLYRQMQDIGEIGALGNHSSAWQYDRFNQRTLSW